jgi:hypothetical protein
MIRRALLPLRGRQLAQVSYRILTHDLGRLLAQLHVLAARVAPQPTLRGAGIVSAGVPGMMN